MISGWLLVAVGANIIAGKCIRKGDSKIYDLGHEILPKMPSCTNDVLLLITMLISLLYTDRLTSKYIKILSLMYLFRAVCVCMTVLPIPDGRGKCKGGVIQHCNDFIFSGHTTFNVVTSYFIGKPLWPVWPMLTSLGTVASRNHYSIDVMLVWLIFCAFNVKI